MIKDFLFRNCIIQKQDFHMGAEIKDGKKMGFNFFQRFCSFHNPIIFKKEKCQTFSEFSYIFFSL